MSLARPMMACQRATVPPNQNFLRFVAIPRLSLCLSRSQNPTPGLMVIGIGARVYKHHTSLFKRAEPLVHRPLPAAADFSAGALEQSPTLLIHPAPRLALDFDPVALLTRLVWRISALRHYALKV